MLMSRTVKKLRCLSKSKYKVIFINHEHSVWIYQGVKNAISESNSTLKRPDIMVKGLINHLHEPDSYWVVLF